MTYKQKIEELIRKDFKSVANFSRATGLNDSAISQLVAGKYKQPTWELMIQIADGLDITLDSLMRDDAPWPPPRKSENGIHLTAEERQILVQAKLVNEVTGNPREALSRLIAARPLSPSGVGLGGETIAPPSERERQAGPKPALKRVRGEGGA